MVTVVCVARMKFVTEPTWMPLPPAVMEDVVMENVSDTIDRAEPEDIMNASPDTAETTLDPLMVTVAVVISPTKLNPLVEAVHVDAVDIDSEREGFVPDTVTHMFPVRVDEITLNTALVPIDPSMLNTALLLPAIRVELVSVTDKRDAGPKLKVLEFRAPVPLA